MYHLRIEEVADRNMAREGWTKGQHKWTNRGSAGAVDLWIYCTIQKSRWNLCKDAPKDQHITAGCEKQADKAYVEYQG